jgi:hypothetical protein
VVGERFDPEAFYALVGATAKERAALRQDLVRGLKEYYETLYGYDRYGAETIFQLEDRMAQPYIFGFGAARILHDRRVSAGTKAAIAERAIAIIRYGTDSGLPYGVFGAIQFLLTVSRLSAVDLRYVLVATAGEYSPFRGMERVTMLDLFRRLVSFEELPAEERAFWAHSLLARHQDDAGAADLCGILLDAADLPESMRGELCLAWLYMRQPRIEVAPPPAGEDERSRFVAEHLPFWIAHVPSWPSNTMVELGLASLPRFGGDPADLIQTYIMYRDGWAEAIHAGVADIIELHGSSISPQVLRSVIERGVSEPSSISSRRRFYRLGSEIFGDEYLQRATHDTAGSVRQWATRQLHKGT